MPKLKVVHPFVLNEASGPVSFTVGEHDISPAQLKHWFLQGCIADGRAFLVQDMPTTPATVEHAEVLPKVEAEKPKSPSGKNKNS